MRLIFRSIACLLLGAVAIFFAMIGAMMPFQLPSQAEKNRAYYQEFRAAAAVIDRQGYLPLTEPAGWKAPSVRNGHLIRSSSTVPEDCDRSFTMAPEDRLTLSFWRGEWTECYAYPSGRTTLSMSLREYLLSGFGLQIAIYWIIAAAAAWGAVRMWPFRTQELLRPTASG